MDQTQSHVYNPAYRFKKKKKKAREWRDVRYRVVKLGVWNKTSEVG